MKISSTAVSTLIATAVYFSSSNTNAFAAAAATPPEQEQQEQMIEMLDAGDRDLRRSRRLKKKTSKASNLSTGCDANIVSSTVMCDAVVGMEWFLTTKEGIGLLQGLTTGLTLEQIKQKTTDPLEDKPPPGNDTDNTIEDRALKKKKSPKPGTPTNAPTAPGDKVSKCAPYLNDPSFDCGAIASMMWFLTTDEGIASLQGLTNGMDGVGCKLVVMDFTATWCGPCQMIAPLFKELSETFPNVLFLKVDVDEKPEIAAKYEIRQIPTFLFIQHGEVIDKVVGSNAADDALQKLLDEYA